MLRVTVTDVGPREGLQNEPALLGRELPGRVYRAGPFPA